MAKWLRYPIVVPHRRPRKQPWANKPVFTWIPRRKRVRRLPKFVSVHPRRFKKLGAAVNLPIFTRVPHHTRRKPKLEALHPRKFHKLAAWFIAPAASLVQPFRKPKHHVGVRLSPRHFHKLASWLGAPPPDTTTPSGIIFKGVRYSVLAPHRGQPKPAAWFAAPVPSWLYRKPKHHVLATPRPRHYKKPAAWLTVRGFFWAQFRKPKHHPQLAGRPRHSHKLAAWLLPPAQVQASPSGISFKGVRYPVIAPHRGLPKSAAWFVTPALQAWLFRKPKHRTQLTGRRRHLQKLASWLSAPPQAQVPATPSGISFKGVRYPVISPHRRLDKSAPWIQAPAQPTWFPRFHKHPHPKVTGKRKFRARTASTIGAITALTLNPPSQPWNWAAHAAPLNLTLGTVSKAWNWGGQAALLLFILAFISKAWVWTKQATLLNLTLGTPSKAWAWVKNMIPGLPFALGLVSKAWSWVARPSKLISVDIKIIRWNIIRPILWGIVRGGIERPKRGP